MDILALGSIYLDINSINVPFTESVAIEKEIVGGVYESVVGGSCSNFLRGCSSLGLKTGMIGKVGQDGIGNFIEDSLLSQRIKPFLLKSPSIRTNIGINLVNNSGKRIMMVLGNSNESMDSKDLINTLPGLIPNIKYLYLGGFFKLLKLDENFYTKVIEVAHKQNVSIFFDHGRVNNIVTRQRIKSVRNIIKHLSENDYYLPSEEEFRHVWKINISKQSLSKFSTTTNATTVIKRAKKGCVCFYNGMYIKQSAYKIKSVSNSVGSGDFFNSGFALAIAKKMSIDYSMKFANAFSAIKISNGKLASYTDTISFIKARGGGLT